MTQEPQKEMRVAKYALVLTAIMIFVGCSKPTDPVETDGSENLITLSPVDDLTAVKTTSSRVLLQWSTPESDTGQSLVKYYELRKAGFEITDENWGEADYCRQVQVYNSDTVGQLHTVEVNQLEANATYHFAVRSFRYYARTTPMSGIVNNCVVQTLSQEYLESYNSIESQWRDIYKVIDYSDYYLLILGQATCFINWGTYQYKYGCNSSDAYDQSVSGDLTRLGWSTPAKKPHALAADDQYVYSMTDSFLYISNGPPVSGLVGSCSLPDTSIFPYSIDLAVKDSYLFSASGSLGIFDVSQPNSPFLYGVDSSLSLDAEGLAIYDTYLILWQKNYTVKIVIADISSVDNIIEVGALTLSSSIASIAIEGSIIVVYTDDQTLHLIDISNPSNPVERSNLSLDHELNCIAIRNDALYTTDNVTGLAVYDIVNPDEIKFVTSYDYYLTAKSVWVREDKIFVNLEGRTNGAGNYYGEIGVFKLVHPIN